MVQQMTWQTFLVATLVLTIIWYVAVVLLFYRREVFRFFRKGTLMKSNQFRRTEPLPHRWEKGVDQIAASDPAAEMELMGKPKLPEGMSSIGSDAFGFGSADDQWRDEQLGLVPDVLQELKLIFSQLAEGDGSKRDFFERMVPLREAFPKIGSSPNIGRINEFIIDHAPFHLSIEEMEGLWD